MKLGLRSELAKRGYRQDEIDDALLLAESLRHLATHRPEDVLVNLDYPERRRTRLRQETLDAKQLGLAIVAADWPVLLVTVNLAARRLAKGAIRESWDEGWFHSRFV